MLIVALLLFALLIVALVIRDLRSAQAVPLLEPAVEPDLSPKSSASMEPAPLVSVIVPARDEAARIGRLLDGLERQTRRDFELLVLDDCSSDGTGALVQARAGSLPGWRLLTGAPLPDGWTGKCWACWQAAEQSRADWLLFLDADTAPAPALIDALIRRARERDLDFLTLLPYLELHSFAERLLMPAFTGLIQAVFPLDQVNDPRSPLAIANGQCILVRREAYFATGGHSTVRGSVLEDVHLALLIKGAAYRTEVAGGPQLLSVRMYTNFSEIAEGLRKNAWAGYSTGGWRSAWGGARQALLAFGPWTVLVAGIIAGARRHASATALLLCGGGLSVFTATFWGYTVRRLHRIHPLWGLLLPFGTLTYFVLAALAWISIRRGTGVRWKGRAYRG
jgi:chlorobactene glucosyltransferase